MRINQHTALSTPAILLVPYSEHHVPTYHEWMQDTDLQAATASEPLSLDEEYAMQRSWRTDHDKLTFIICAPLDAARSASDNASVAPVKVGHDDRPEAMMGDVNLFLFRPDSDGPGKGVAGRRGDVVGEVELMVAPPALRRKGHGRAALLVFLDYVLNDWRGIAAEYARQGRGEIAEGEKMPVPQLSFLRAKVKTSNAASIRLFESAGFVKTAEEANYFGEVELRWLPDVEGLRAARGWRRASSLRYEER